MLCQILPCAQPSHTVTTIPIVSAQEEVARLELEVAGLKNALMRGETSYAADLQNEFEELKYQFDRDPRNWGDDGPPADILLMAGVVMRPRKGEPVYSRHAVVRSPARLLRFSCRRPARVAARHPAAAPNWRNRP